MKPYLSVIVASYKNPGLLELCLSSLKKNITGIDYEIIVTDNATEEETFDLMREKFPDVKFIPNENNTGFGGIANQGINASNGKYLFIINSDIIIKESKAISELVEYLENNSKAGIVGPRLVNFDNSIQPSFFKFYTPLTIIYRRTFLKKFGFAKKHLRRFLMQDEISYEKANQVDWLMGSAMMTKKSAVEKVGKMDTKNFFMYFEDVDWCWRFWQNGFQVVYLPTAQVYHYHGKQSASRNAINAVLMNKYTRIHISSAIKFFLKHLGEKNPRSKYKEQTTEK